MRANLFTLTACLLAGTASAASEKSAFKPDKDGKYWIYGEGISAAFIPYGASITDLLVKDQYGIERDVVMGFDNATYYEVDKQHAHLGGIVGRYANRIKNSTFEIDGVEYKVKANDNPTPEYPEGLDTLHGGPDGWDWRTFNVVSYTNNSITFSLVDPDGKEGFPGEVVSYVTYTLGKMTWDFKIVAIATTKKTPIMLSNHGYWNLDGFANNETQSVLNHTFYLPYSGQRVDVDPILIPTGDIAANKKGSVNDFWSAPKQIASGFKDKEIEGNCGGGCDGYDNCWLVNKPSPIDWRADGNYVARLQSAWSGIQLDIYSDQEAFQMYSCNFQNGSMTLKKGQGLYDNEDFPRTVPKYGCLVLEVEDWIDAINHPEWHRSDKHFIEPGGDPYVVQASYRFSINSTVTPY
ncbi:Galactose mutarotase-like domain containing protein [Rhypophila sp. PSN 637]